ncbi:MAG: FeoB-associated Cys-rich membrane protein [Muribaculaceae bacterium]|nr:FeoB-associated Cys-rich membrane protein [Muribaculaceae bacterium]
MTTSTIIQTIIVLGIVAVALVYVLRRVIKTTRGKGGDCGCGCGKNCHNKNKPGKEY